MKSKIQLLEGYRIVKRGELNSTSTPIDCPLCSCVLVDEMDEISIVRSSCCFDCESEIADINREQWLNGWRPSGDELQAIKVKRLSSPHSRVHI